MLIFKTKIFNRWMQEVGMEDESLVAAVSEIEDGLYDAKLGGCVYKKRVSLPGKGKRSGMRTILAFKMDEKAIFLYGYAKNKRSTITEKEEKALKTLATIYFGYSEEQLKQALKNLELIEVT